MPACVSRAVSAGDMSRTMSAGNMSWAVPGAHMSTAMTCTYVTSAMRSVRSAVAVRSTHSGCKSNEQRTQSGAQHVDFCDNRQGAHDLILNYLSQDTPFCCPVNRFEALKD
jgi:hypothetical protein